jgi:hypothetical protein
MEGLYRAMAVLSAIMAGMVLIWAVSERARWPDIRNTVLYVAFSIGATFVFFVIVGEYRGDLAVAVTTFAVLFIAVFLVARALNQI